MLGPRTPTRSQPEGLWVLHRHPVTSTQTPDALKTDFRMPSRPGRWHQDRRTGPLLTCTSDTRMRMSRTSRWPRGPQRSREEVPHSPRTAPSGPLDSCGLIPFLRSLYPSNRPTGDGLATGVLSQLRVSPVPEHPAHTSSPHTQTATHLVRLDILTAHHLHTRTWAPPTLLTPVHPHCCTSGTAHPLTHRLTRTPGPLTWTLKLPYTLLPTHLHSCVPGHPHLRIHTPGPFSHTLTHRAHPGTHKSDT